MFTEKECAVLRRVLSETARANGEDVAGLLLKHGALAELTEADLMNLARKLDSAGDAFEVMLVRVPAAPSPDLWCVRVYKNETLEYAFGTNVETSARTFLGGVVQGLTVAGFEPAVSGGEEGS